MTGRTAANGGVAFDQDDLPGGDWVMEKVEIGTAPGTTTEVLIGRPSGSVGEHGVHLKFASGGGAGSYTLEHRPADSSGFIPIGSYDEFQLINDPANLAGHYKQETDLDLLGDKDGDGTCSDQKWAAIGADASRFTGTFDGAEKGITNLYIDETGDYQGLFGYAAAGSTISNVHILSGTVTGASSVGGVAGFSLGTITGCVNNGDIDGTGDNIGGVVGYLNGTSASITGCANKGTVTGAGNGNYVGGVVGHSTTTKPITGCKNSGVITGRYRVGGVLGRGLSTPITNCENSGDIITINSMRAGCIVGANEGSNAHITGCKNSGNISAAHAANGGIAGVVSGNVKDCVNTGNVTHTGGQGIIGGVVGQLSGSAYSLINCSNSGDIYGGGTLGGVAGRADGSVIGCSNTGKVNGYGENVGGVVGRALGTIIGCYNTGDVTGTRGRTTHAGGVAGYAAVAITACYNTGDVTATNGSSVNTGGVVGYNDVNSTTTACYNTGTVTGITNVGGVAGQSKKTVIASYNTGAVSGTSGIGGVVGDNYGASSDVIASYFANNSAAAGYGTNSGTITSLNSFLPGAFPDVSAVHAAWGTGSGSDDDSSGGPTTNGWWKPGTTNGSTLPKLWFE
jgi:hypothetical protein